MWAFPPPNFFFDKTTALRLSLVGFGSLADCLKFVFKPPAIIHVPCMYYDVIIFQNLGGGPGGGGGGDPETLTILTCMFLCAYMYKLAGLQKTTGSRHIRLYQ